MSTKIRDGSAEFQAAADKAQNFKTRPSDAQLLELYALFKQAQFGDNDTTRPGTFDFKGKAKWDKWTELKGKSPEEADAEYIKLVEKLSAEHGVKE